MKLDVLQSAMIAAMKARDKARKDSIGVLVSAVKKAGIDAGCREDIPEEMVDQAIMKEVKSVKEQLDTCPKERTVFPSGGISTWSRIRGSACSSRRIQ